MPATEHLSNLQRLLSMEDGFQKLGTRPTTGTVVEAARLIDAMTKTVGAMFRYLCAKMEGLPQTVGIDPAVAAVLARVLIEQHETFAYLCLGKLPAAEREFRHLIYYLHKDKEEAKILPCLPSFVSPDEDYFQGVGENISRMALEKNQYFLALSAKTRAHLLNGNSAFFNSASQGSGRGVSRDPETASLYKLFSNVVHATSLGLLAAKPSSYRRRLDGHNLIALALCCAVRVFAASLDEYTRLRPKIRATLTKLERMWLSAIRAYPLEMWPSKARSTSECAEA